MIKKINDYQILSKIASGGMSEIYLADDISSGKKVALKILDAKLSIDPEYLHRFKKEASICQQLDHKNIVKILSYGTFKESYYIAYEYIEGITLDKLIRQKNITITEIENISVQILEALSFAHSKNIIHRDIKPSNIMIEDGTVKILDFGIAKQELASTVTKAGLFMGSPHYVSPEQIEGHDIDYRSDLYSFGIVLYEMIEGKVPFSADTPWGIIRAHLDKNIPEITKDIPIYLKEIVLKCLSKSKEDRFKSANEIISVIKNKEETGKKTVIIDKTKDSGIFVTGSQSFVNDKIKENVKRKRKGKILASVLVPILLIMVYFITGLSFFGAAYNFYNEKNYLSASYNFKIASYFLIPNSQGNIFHSLDLQASEIIKFIEEKEYGKVSSSLSDMKKYFPEYSKISEIENILENTYNDKKNQYIKFLASEDYQNAKKTLSEMNLLKLGNDSYAILELEKVNTYLNAESLLSQADNYFNQKNYAVMYETLDKINTIIPDYPKLINFYEKINKKHESLKDDYSSKFLNYRFDECKSILNEILTLKKDSESFVNSELEKIELFIESDDYISQANELVGNKKINEALKILDEAIKKNSDYPVLNDLYKDVKNKKNKYAGYIAKINEIEGVLNSGNIIEAYNSANKLLNSSDFASVVFQEDINKLKNIKNKAYDQGKNIVGNNGSFNLYEKSGWQSKNINNIFGVKMYEIEFTGWNKAQDNANKFISFAVDINWEAKSILLTGDRLILTKSGENLLNYTRRENPGVLVDIARNGQSYTVSAENRNFVITINSMGVDDYWFSSLNVTVSLQQ
ncbi:MAG: protein kinase domain-containing protein [Candidatus Humimicrobiaceae bacterium]